MRVKLATSPDSPSFAGTIRSTDSAMLSSTQPRCRLTRTLSLGPYKIFDPRFTVRVHPVVLGRTVGLLAIMVVLRFVGLIATTVTPLVLVLIVFPIPPTMVIVPLVLPMVIVPILFVMIVIMIVATMLMIATLLQDVVPAAAN